MKISEEKRMLMIITQLLYNQSMRLQQAETRLQLTNDPTHGAFIDILKKYNRTYQAAEIKFENGESFSPFLSLFFDGAPLIPGGHTGNLPIYGYQLIDDFEKPPEDYLFSGYLGCDLGQTGDLKAQPKMLRYIDNKSSKYLTYYFDDPLDPTAQQQRYKLKSPSTFNPPGTFTFLKSIPTV